MCALLLKSTAGALLRRPGSAWGDRTPLRTSSPRSNISVNTRPNFFLHHSLLSISIEGISSGFISSITRYASQMTKEAIKDNATENIRERLGNDVALLVDSQVMGPSYRVVLPLYPLRGKRQQTIAAHQTTFSQLKCHQQTGRDGELTFLGVPRTDKGALKSNLRIADQNSPFCTVKEHEAGVLKEAHKQGFFPHFRNFMVVLDYTVIAEELKDRSIVGYVVVLQRLLGFLVRLMLFFIFSRLC